VRPLPWALAALLACAGAPQLSMPGKSGVWGYVRLVPHEGVAAHDTAGASSGAYGDRRYADAELVDYSKPGFAVVWADGPTPPASAARIGIRDGAAHAVFDPPHAALGVGGAIAVVNHSADAHLVSCPGARLVQRLAPGASLEIRAETAGEWALFLLDAGDERARVFAAPGPFQVVSAAGRFALSDLDPATTRVHAWHPRFPPASVAVALAAGASARADLELRVDRAADGPGDAR
jgi:hypothetical protein